MHVLPKDSFVPLVPLMVINLVLVRQRSILHIRKKVCFGISISLLFPEGHPTPCRSPFIFYLHIPSWENTHSTLDGKCTPHCVILCRTVQNSSMVSALWKSESLIVCWSSKRWQWPLEERLTWQLPLGSLAVVGRLSWAERRSVRS